MLLDLTDITAELVFQISFQSHIFLIKVSVESIWQGSKAQDNKKRLFDKLIFLSNFACIAIVQFLVRSLETFFTRPQGFRTPPILTIKSLTFQRSAVNRWATYLYAVKRALSNHVNECERDLFLIMFILDGKLIHELDTKKF